MSYPKKPYSTGHGRALLMCENPRPSLVGVRPPLPGNMILIHGVNDTGTSYEAAESGLCAGLEERLAWSPGLFPPASYRMPRPDDNGRLMDDPDAVLYKRSVTAGTYSPVIPFYWGFSEVKRLGKSRNGQRTDHFGNRMNKDLTKGGGPFANATTALPDLWARGAAYFGGAIDRKVKDPLRPVLGAPGRMYMVLAAKRLANLATMIRAYDAADTVSVVAHSQGCLVSLLAQALLLQAGQRPIDTLVLTHPPYSLEEPAIEDDARKAGEGGTDEAMLRNAQAYGYVDSGQTLYARLQTLSRIVHGTFQKRDTEPWFADAAAAAKQGRVGCRWEPSKDRDNRGKVYLYFCPEDMTVAFKTVRGIGWQGVPDEASGLRSTNQVDATRVRREAATPHRMETYTCQPRAALGPSFLQRVFTAKLRPDRSGKPAPVSVGAPPGDFVLRLPREDDHAHVDPSNTTLRAELPFVEPGSRAGLRAITGEALAEPYLAVMDAGAIANTGGRFEVVDAIDAAISVTSDYGLQEAWRVLDDLSRQAGGVVRDWNPVSPAPEVFNGPTGVKESPSAAVEALLNAGRVGPTQQRELLEVHPCLKATGRPDDALSTRQLLVKYKESPDDARLRQQTTGRSARSFHSAIFGSRENHRHVTAYDLAIGQGNAASDPAFYAYLCAVADWRLKKLVPNDLLRVGILLWKDFLVKYQDYFDAEPPERRAIIEGNCDYYTTGVLPELQVLPDGLPPAVASENQDGQRLNCGDADATPPPVRPPPLATIGSRQAPIQPGSPPARKPGPP